jgi:hypothetical protein
LSLVAAVAFLIMLVAVWDLNGARAGIPPRRAARVLALAGMLAAWLLATRNVPTTDLHATLAVTSQNIVAAAALVVVGV